MSLDFKIHGAISGFFLDLTHSKYSFNISHVNIEINGVTIPPSQVDLQKEKNLSQRSFKLMLAAQKIRGGKGEFQDPIEDHW